MLELMTSLAQSLVSPPIVETLNIPNVSLANAVTTAAAAVNKVFATITFTIVLALAILIYVVIALFIVIKIAIATANPLVKSTRPSWLKALHSPSRFTTLFRSTIEGHGSEGRGCCGVRPCG